MLVPGSLLECTKLDLLPGIKDALGNKLILIIGNLSNLRANIHTQVLSHPQEIVSAACTIEADLIAWLAALPPDFTYSSHTLMPMDRSFERRCHGIRPYNGEYHIYPDIWSPSCWNHYRCARILVSEIILSHVHKLSNSSPSSLSEDFRLHCKSLRSTIRRLGADICPQWPIPPRCLQFRGSSGSHHSSTRELLGRPDAALASIHRRYDRGADPSTASVGEKMP